MFLLLYATRGGNNLEVLPLIGTYMNVVLQFVSMYKLHFITIDRFVHSDYEVIILVWCNNQEKHFTK